MFYKKITSILLVIAILFSLSACGSEKVNKQNSEIKVDTAETKKTITLLYSAADGFNPYKAKTETNRNLLKLVYEPLVKLDNEFGAVYTVAKAVTVKGKTCTVTLKDTSFSDGSSLTATDVVYSFNLAKKSKTGYASKLYNIKDVSASDNKTLKFTLKKHDPYCANILTFPILKKGSETKTDSDGVLIAPIGSGKFKVNSANDGLVANDKSGYKGLITSVRLINAPDMESVTHYAQIGAADIYYSDISDGSLTRMTGEKQNINLNNLVYLGINKNNSLLNENLLRQAISTAIDRNVICQNAYFNNALAATGFFSPVWNETKSVQNIQNTTNKEITIENLEKIGYNRLDSDGVRQNESGKKLKFTLLVNSDNNNRVLAAKLVKSQLESFGFKISIVKKSYKEYLKALKSGDFELYLAEVKLTENMDISSLVSKGGSAAYGVRKSKKNNDSQKTIQEVVNGFYEGKNSIADLSNVLQGQMPFVPVCYRTATLFYNDKIENVNNSSERDIYFSIDSYIYY